MRITRNQLRRIIKEELEEDSDTQARDFAKQEFNLNPVVRAVRALRPDRVGPFKTRDEFHQYAREVLESDKPPKLELLGLEGFSVDTASDDDIFAAILKKQAPLHYAHPEMGDTLYYTPGKAMRPTGWEPTRESRRDQKKFRRQLNRAMQF
jgi:hypothetical protein